MVSKRNQATESQKKFLEDWKVIPPPTKVGCNSLIYFLKEVQFRGGMDIGDRSRWLRKLQDEWINREVRFEGEACTVKYLIADENVSDRRNQNLDVADMRFPFRFYVVDKKGKFKGMKRASMLDCEHKPKPVQP